MLQCQFSQKKAVLVSHFLATKGLKENFLRGRRLISELRLFSENMRLQIRSNQAFIRSVDKYEYQEFESDIRSHR